MGLLEGKVIEGFICPGCEVFSTDPNLISHHDGTCSNCQEYFIMPVTISPIDLKED